MIKCFGTVYRLHPLFVIMMALSVMTGYFIELLVLFGIVVLHELGHAFAARMYGWSVTEIQLFPFGGVAVVEASGSVTAKQEIVVALAGPLQNVIMIAFSMGMEASGLWDKSWSAYFIRANLTIALFNLLPVLPLDGGRILQALLSRFCAYYQTLVATVWVSLIAGAGLILYCIYRLPHEGVNVNLLVIAFFLLVSNGYEYKNLYYRFMRFLVVRESRTRYMLNQGSPAQPIAVERAYKAISVAKLLKRECYHLIYVWNENGTLKTVMPEQALIREALSGETANDYELRSAQRMTP